MAVTPQHDGESAGPRDQQGVERGQRQREQRVEAQLLVEAPCGVDGVADEASSPWRGENSFTVTMLCRVSTMRPVSIERASDMTWSGRACAHEEAQHRQIAANHSTTGSASPGIGEASRNQRAVP